MKDVKLVERKQSDRLVKLVDAIPKLGIYDGKVVVMSPFNQKSPIYDIMSGRISYRHNADLIAYNHLRNCKKLLIANESFIHITEESFCDLLEEHLYMVAKEKMEELLPKIQEHYPTAEILEDRHSLSINEKSIDVVVYTQFEVKGCTAFEGIWEDRENLIVKKPKWWETENYFYRIYLDKSVLPHTMAIIRCFPRGYSKELLFQNADITYFETREKAQVMCDKLNVVLKGE